MVAGSLSQIRTSGRDAAPGPRPPYATDAPELELPEGTSSGDDWRKLVGEETDEGFGEPTEP